MKKSYAEIIAVALLMLAVGVAASWPLADHFFTAIPCRTTAGRLFLNKPGDQLQLLYWFWLLRDNLFGGAGFGFMHNPYEFNMTALHSPAGLYMYPLYFFYLLFSPLGDIGAYNALILLSYVLTGLFTYLLVKQYTGSRAGALLGALVYTLVPIRIINMMGGHLNGFIYYLLPASLYFLDRAILKKSVLSAGICGLLIFWLSLLEVHLIYYFCLFLAAYIPLRLVFCGESDRQETEIQETMVSGMEEKWNWWPAAVLVLTAFSLTIVYQGLSALKYHHPLLTTDFWVILSLYPFFFLAVGLFFSLLLAAAFRLSLHNSVRIVALGSLPLNLLSICVLNLSLKVPLLSWIVVICVLLLLPVAGRQAWKRYGSNGRPQWSLVRQWFAIKPVLRILPIVVGLLFSVIWVLVAKKVFFVGSVAHGGRTIQDVKLFSPRLYDLYTQGSDVYLGLVPLLLILYCLFMLIRRIIFSTRNRSTRKLLLPGFFLCVFFLTYILGAGLSFGSSSLYTFFFDYFPFFNYPRVPDRIMTIAFLAGAVLSGFAIGDLQRSLVDRQQKRIGFVFYCLLIGLLWHDFGVGKPVALTNLDWGQTIYKYVKKNIDGGLLLEIPLWPGDSHQSSLYEYYITLDRVRRVNGYTPIVKQKYIDTIYKPLSTLNMGLLDARQYAQLKKMGVRFITVHDNPDVFPRKVSPFPAHITVRRLMNSPYLKFVPVKNMMDLPGLVRENKKLYLFQLVDHAPPLSETAEQATCRFFIPNVYHATALPHITGKPVLDATIGQRVLKATMGRDKVHFLNYGPYEELPAGRYQVYFRLRTNKPGIAKQIARLDVSTFVNHEQQVILSQKKITGKDFKGTGYQDFTLDFSLSAFRRVEFRTWFSGNADLYLEKIVLTCGGQHGFDSRYEAESLLGDTGFMVRDTQASDGKAVKADVLDDPPGRMVYGPFRKLPAGRYRVTFFLRSDSRQFLDPKKPIVAELRVTTDENATVLAAKNVVFGEISGQEYRPVSVDILMKRDNEVSFNVRFTKQANVLVDRIDIE